MSTTSKIISMIMSVILFVSAVSVANAVVPVGVDTLTRGNDETMNYAAYLAKSTTAYAGNITEINFTAITQTKHWQGYYGTITGTIVLDDAQNYTLYDWPNIEPKGEIYVTVNATTPSWATMTCFDYEAGIGSGNSNLSHWEAFYNMTWNDVDGIDETFNLTSHITFDIGDVVTIAEDTCPSTYMHQNDLFQEDKWSEVLLMDGAGRLVYTGIIENDDEANNTDPQGFKTSGTFTPDFQLIVAEDGTGRDAGVINTATTTYYFYVDLE
jgi:hypothetical protein